MVISEVQLLQTGEVAQFRGDGARQSVGVEAQLLQIIVVLQVGPSQVFQFRGDGARQLVVVEVQLLQTGEVAQYRGDGARQLVVVEVQPP